ncbi:MAG: beta-phosphoglucomutase family hydrolase [Candidatus Omnitrophota bacterium]|nr:MAG: beta-phosphoglucomutase family hydrolase [Candidatus Omnitrophota bacterium]
MFKAAIFDLDGVIVNTVPLHFKAWKKLFSDYGIEFSFDDYKAKVDGIPRYDGTKAILTGLSDAEIKKAGDKKQRYFLELLEKGEIDIYNSSLDLIKELKRHNKKIAIASSSRNCKKILQKTGIIKLADAIVDGNDLKRGKPDPQIFQLAADRIGCGYQECVVFEDAVLGVEAAINGKMLCVGIDRYGTAERLKKATIVVDDLSKIDHMTLEKLFK